VRSHRWRGRSASGRRRAGVGPEADVDEARSPGDLERDRRHPGSSERTGSSELRRAHLPHAPLTRTPTTRHASGVRRLGERGRSPDPPRSLLTGPSGRRTSELWHPHAHVIAAKKAGHDVGRDQVARLMAMSGIWGDERHRGVTTDAVVPTSLPTLSAGSFTRNVRTRAESRTGPPSAPPKG